MKILLFLLAIISYAKADKVRLPNLGEVLTLTRTYSNAHLNMKKNKDQTIRKVKLDIYSVVSEWNELVTVAKMEVTSRDEQEYNAEGTCKSVEAGIQCHFIDSLGFITIQESKRKGRNLMYINTKESKFSQPLNLVRYDENSEEMIELKVKDIAANEPYSLRLKYSSGGAFAICELSDGLTFVSFNKNRLNKIESIEDGADINSAQSKPSQTSFNIIRNSDGKINHFSSKEIFAYQVGNYISIGGLYDVAEDKYVHSLQFNYNKNTKKGSLNYEGKSFRVTFCSF